MEDPGVLSVLLVFLTSIWYILCPFAIVSVTWYIFSRFGMFYQKKSGNPAPVSTLLARRPTRVTRLGEFSPIGWLFSLNSFF
jgi:hypothetical protein